MENEKKIRRGRPKTNPDAPSRKKYDFDKMSDSELQEEYLKTCQEKTSVELFTDELGETHSLFQYVMKGVKRAKLEGISFELPAHLKTQYEALNTITRKIGLFKEEIESREFQHNLSILDNYQDKLIELIAKGYSLREIHEVILENTGKKNLPFLSIEKFKEKYQIDIANRAKLYEDSLDDLSFTKKRHRIQELSDLYYSRRKLYKDAPSVQNSAEMRAILNQIKDESEGLVLKVDMDIKHAIEIHIKQDEITNLNPLMIVLSSVAGKQGINPNWIMARLAQSYYAKVNGFVTDPSQAYQIQEVMFPSQVEYDFEKIESLAKAVNEQDKKEMFLAKQELPEEKQSSIDAFKQALINRLKGNA